MFFVDFVRCRFFRFSKKRTQSARNICNSSSCDCRCLVINGPIIQIGRLCDAVQRVTRRERVVYSRVVSIFRSSLHCRMRANGLRALCCHCSISK